MLPPLLAKLGKGIKILKPEESIDLDLGPLSELKGTWVSHPFDGWNVIAVPGPTSTQGFTLEVIPYKETFKFTPVVVATNRGPVVNGVQEEQHITGLVYEQTITSVCDSPLCKKMGFAAGQIIHAETGLFMNVLDFNTSEGTTTGPLNIARLSVIPHGNSVLAMGHFQHGVPANNDFFPVVPISPSSTDGSQLPFGYGELQYGPLQFPDFDQSNPNSALRKKLGNAQLIDMTTLVMSTKSGTGGILNIPFIQTNINTTDMNAIFWIERIKNPKPNHPDIMQLQYSQTINLVFPATGTTQLITWPHVTVATLQKER